ncbi:MAG: hypothetical protein QOJ81_1637 [Chloroflexota bacterium]|jgi:hypothetical protein|nr:hypothetical protein [Chloroflexota bacterium]
MKLVAFARPRQLSDINWAWLLATGFLAASVISVLAAIVLWAGQRFQPPPVSFIDSNLVFVAEMFYAIAYAGMGWLLATRLPGNVLGWLFQVLGLGMAAQLVVTFLVQEGHEAFRQLSYPLLLAAWIASSVHLPMLAVLTNTVFLRFPTGRPLTPRWRGAGWLAFFGAVLVIAGIGLQPSGLTWYPSLTNVFAAPFAARPLLGPITLLGMSMLIVGVGIGTASMVVRYHRSNDRERAQLRWIAVAVVLLALCGVPFVIVRYGLQADYATGHALLATALIAGCMLPVAAAVAILHHRLYDIDLILSRALVYVPLTAILAGMYAAGVALFQRLFVAVTGDKSDGAVVITTLILAGLFTPVRNGLQSFVDRRFKPSGGQATDGHHDIHTVQQRLAALEERLQRLESPDQQD